MYRSKTHTHACAGNTHLYSETCKLTREQPAGNTPVQVTWGCLCLIFDSCFYRYQLHCGDCLIHRIQPGGLCDHEQVRCGPRLLQVSATASLYCWCDLTLIFLFLLLRLFVVPQVCFLSVLQRARVEERFWSGGDLWEANTGNLPGWEPRNIPKDICWVGV